ncbi:gliding motility-associated C-terminal domain-containing protein [Alkalitalea saponilacus]|uniref:C-terminal domain of CHU protein family protein n=1 Tax=Alkalitalea saponilacus TaxID=889453 RepID=A0A1T5AGQ6_9BACT|nr:gliding motility-associated C-terminal domain-containing protein [Alkalitalea saponilacus]ASB48706.1 hypothetical protein CDL62_05890 [Alkalitalea saponilacus]SKB34144.1 C-terminal domain of CHU protein family protein [Alkalitalea saponilacus]
MFSFRVILKAKDILHMGRCLSYVTGLLLFLGSVGNIEAQTPSAELLDDVIEVCETGEFQIRIRFTGVEPFNAWIEFSDADEESEWNGERGPAYGNVDAGPPRRLLSGIYDDNANMSNGVYTYNTTFADGWLNRTREVKINIVEFFHGEVNGDWIIGQGEKQNIIGELLVISHQRPAPFAGDPVDQCGYSTVLNAQPDPVSTSYWWELIDGASFGENNSDFENPNALFTVETDGIYDLKFLQENGACTPVESEVQVVLKGSPSGEIRTNSEVCGIGDAEVEIELLQGYGPMEFIYQLNGENFIRTGDPGNSYLFSHENVPGKAEFQLISIEDVNGCFATEAQLSGEAIVAELTPQINAGENEIVCGATFSLNAWGEPGDGAWSSQSAFATFSDPDSENSQVDVSQYGDFVFTWSMNNEGCEASDQITIRFVEYPDVVAQLIDDLICEGDETILTFNAQGSGPWTVRLNDDDISFGTTVFNQSLAPEQTEVYHLHSIIDTYGCETTFDDLVFSVSVDEMPSPYAGNDREICGESIQLSAVPSVGIGTWSGSGSFANASDPTTVFYPDSFHELVAPTLRWTEVNGVCTAYDEISVTFYHEVDPMDVDAGDDIEVYHQFAINLNAMTPPLGVGTWEILSGEGNLLNSNDPKSEISGLTFGSVALRWTVKNGICPEFSDELTIEVKGLVHPTGFSPNEIPDGFNDRFVIKGATHISNNRLMVFNQAGEIVYQKQNYGGDDENFDDPGWWDGKDSRGNPVPEGTYYFVFTGDGIDPVKDYLVIKR